MLLNIVYTRALRLIAILILASTLRTQAQSTVRPLRCEDPVDGEPAFTFSPAALSCVSSGCYKPNIPGTPDYNPNIAPGAYNATDVSYCAASCLRPGLSSQQLALAPTCWDYCSAHDAATPEQQGWCMYWCVDGKSDLVQSTTCEPEIARVPATTVIGAMTETYLCRSPCEPDILTESGR